MAPYGSKRLGNGRRKISAIGVARRESISAEIFRSFRGASSIKMAIRLTSIHEFPLVTAMFALSAFNEAGLIAGTAKTPAGDGRAVLLLPAEMKEVSFGGDATKYHELKSDDAATTYAAPHWVDNNGDSDAADIPQSEHNYARSKSRPRAQTRSTHPRSCPDEFPIARQAVSPRAR